MKLTDNFSLEEFIDPDTFKMFGASSIRFIDSRLLDIAQKLRARLGFELYVNSWFMNGGSFSFSGFRPPGCQVGAPYSAHRLGHAMDIKTYWRTQDRDEAGADEIYDEVTRNYETIYKPLGLTTIESREFTPTWVHLSVQWTRQDGLYYIKP